MEDDLDINAIYISRKPQWMKDGLCYTRTELLDDFFGFHPTEQARAKQVCEGCPSQGPCLRFALRHNIKFGVWGGRTERERRVLRRRLRSSGIDRTAEPSTAFA